MTNNRGQIEIIVLGVIFLLSIFVFSLAHRVGIEHKITKSRLSELQAYFLARAGVESVFSEIKSDTSNADSFNEGWGNQPEDYEKKSLGNGFFEVINSNNPDMFGAGDEEGKININFAGKETLIGFFLKVVDENQAKALAETIIKHRGDGEKAFNLKEELLLIPEISKDIYVKIKDFITVYGKGKININTANKEVLAGLNLTDDLVRKISDYREGMDRILGTEDDRIFDSVATIESKLAGYTNLTQEERAKLNACKNLLGVRSDNFSFVSYGWMEENIKKSIRVVVAREEEGLKIKYWYEE